MPIGVLLACRGSLPEDELSAEDLSGRAFGDRIHEFHPPDAFIVADPCSDVIHELLCGAGAARGPLLDQLAAVSGPLPQRGHLDVEARHAAHVRRVHTHTSIPARAEA